MTKSLQLLCSALLVFALGLVGLATTPSAARADHCTSCKPCYTPPCYTPPCYPKVQPPSYHYEYQTCYVKVPYTCYDECGHPYTAYKVESVQKQVKIAD